MLFRRMGCGPLQRTRRIGRGLHVCGPRSRRRKVRFPSFPPVGENCGHSLAPPLPTQTALPGLRGGPIDCHAHVAAKNGLDLIRAPAPGGAYKRFHPDMGPRKSACFFWERTSKEMKRWFCRKAEPKRNGLCEDEAQGEFISPEQVDLWGPRRACPLGRELCEAFSALWQGHAGRREGKIDRIPGCVRRILSRRRRFVHIWMV